MLMDNTLELLGITDSNIKITRFSAESVNGEKRNGLTYNVDRCPYCESEKIVRNGSKILHTGGCFTKIPLTLKLPGRFIYGESMNT